MDDFIAKGHNRDTIVVFLPAKTRYLSENDENVKWKLDEKCIMKKATKRRYEDDTISSHDDYYILNYAAMKGAVVVTRDNYRDHVNNPRHPEWNTVIRDRILMPTFVGDDIEWPEDPLGRTGPRLDEFLRF